MDLHADFSFDSSRGDMPLDFRIKGRYQRQPLTAQGRTGNVLQLNAAGQPPFPLEIDAAAGHTRLKAKGTVAELASLDGIDARFDLKGQNLGDLYRLLGDRLAPDLALCAERRAAQARQAVGGGGTEGQAGPVRHRRRHEIRPVAEGSAPRPAPCVRA